MSDAVSLAIALAVGLLLGALYFLGLWWTVRRAVRHGDASLLAVSWLLRTSIVVAGFVFVAGGDPSRLVASLVGFTVARVAVLRRSGSPSTAGGDSWN